MNSIGKKYNLRLRNEWIVKRFNRLLLFRNKIVSNDRNGREFFCFFFLKETLENIIEDILFFP